MQTALADSKTELTKVKENLQSLQATHAGKSFVGLNAIVVVLLYAYIQGDVVFYDSAIALHCIPFGHTL